MKEATDFREESIAVSALLASLSEKDCNRPTAFKTWTVNDIIRHLHVWNKAALLQISDEAALKSLLKEVAMAAHVGAVREFEYKASDGLSGSALFSAWLERVCEVADAFGQVDPAQRLIWGGPTMSARSSMSARFMETWAHSQAIYDELGRDRLATDNIRNIVVLGQNTYEFCYKIRGSDAPKPRPSLNLIAPSGEHWAYGDVENEEKISGQAVEFCQVVTQCRNIADTSLEVSGRNASSWMQIAQCFAGPPHDPPEPGTRKKRADILRT